MSHLRQLVGKKIKGISHEISRIIPLQSPTEKLDLDLYLQITFEEYTVNIYNRHYLEGTRNLEALIGFQLSKVTESPSEVTFEFGENQIRVDMTDAAYTGPEAIALYGPNNLIQVWN